jgi:hypothetical protein
MRLKALLLLTLLAMLALSLTPIKSAPATPIIKVQHLVEVQSTSGAVYLNTTVTVTNPSNDSSPTSPWLIL